MTMAEKIMTTLTISPEGQITLPPEILQLNPWKNIDQLVMLHLVINLLEFAGAHSNLRGLMV
jgi:hypothetical protein